MKSIWLSVIVAVVAALASPASVPAADLSVAGGAYVVSAPSQASAAILVSSAKSVPALPLELQATVLLPIEHIGGYAITGEIRGLSGGGFGGAYVGAGAGIGNLRANRRTGMVLTAFVGKPIAPLTTFELRIYKGTQDNGTTAGFLGVRFTF